MKVNLFPFFRAQNRDTALPPALQPGPRATEGWELDFTHSINSRLPNFLQCNVCWAKWSITGGDVIYSRDCEEYLGAGSGETCAARAVSCEHQFLPKLGKLRGQLGTKQKHNFARTLCCSKRTKHRSSASSQLLLSGSQLSQPVCT